METVLLAILLAQAPISSPSDAEGTPYWEREEDTAETTSEVTETGMVIVEATGFPSDEGIAFIGIFSRSGWAFPPRPEMAEASAEVVIEDCAARLECDGLPLGEYVVLVYHDADSNHTLDMESEMVGFSGSLPQPGRGGGPPGFESYAVEHMSEVDVIRVTVEKFAPPEDREGRRGPPGGGRGGSRPL